jgi:phage gp46-like protein
LWDSIWKPWDGVADWAIADADEPQNRGGLRAKAALHTAIIICLFTDRRMPKTHPLYKFVDDGDQRGWWGDGEDVRDDLHETELGSYLWVLERATLTEEVRRYVEIFAIEALSTLISQGVCARIEAQAVAQFAINRCDLSVQLYARDGTLAVDVRFDDLWKQSLTSPKPERFPTTPP